MADFRIDTLAALCRQMGFTPLDVRQTQLANAESLLHSLEANKAYPSDFVMFRITGYRPKSVSGDMLAGAALQHDLGLLIERVSETLDLHAGGQPEPVLSIDDVTEQFNVASKTIQRWRRRGLPSRRFTFPDGKRRVGFLLSSVERFINAQRTQVMTSANVSLVSDAERAQIVRRARRLATNSRCWEDEIARRLGRRMKRSPLTILHTLRRWDTEHPKDAILPLAADPLTDADRARCIRGARRGRSLKDIARRIGRPRWVVYRALLDRRIEKVSSRKVRFIDDPLYRQPDSEEIMRAIGGVDGALDPTPASPIDSRVPRDLPPYLQALYRPPLLSAQQERALFLKFNYHKYRFVQARRKLEPQMARSRELKTLEAHLTKAIETKNVIVQANLRLVVSVARKHARPGVSMMELVSDGNLSLMRAAESFDVHRGNKFSTYATLALMKGFARSVPLMQSGGPAVSVERDLLHALPDSRFAPTTDRLAHRDEVAQLLRRLTGRETQVLLSRFGLNERGIPMAPDELAVMMGISAQRVRQIEQVALAKLRTVRAGYERSN